jgi:hypothetical protein
VIRISVRSRQVTPIVLGDGMIAIPVLLVPMIVVDA